MTTFHDTILAMDPDIFVPFDVQGDTALEVVDLVDETRKIEYGSGGALAASVGEVAFESELQLDGVDDRWNANSALLIAITGAVFNQTAVTICAWWRTTNTAATDRYMCRLGSSWGFHLRKSASTITAHFYDTGSVQHSASRASSNSAELGGGWQMSTFELDPVEDMVCVGRNGVRVFDDPLTADPTIRTSGTGAFYYGSNGSANYWLGSLGPLMIWSRGLTPDEHLDVFQAGLGASRLNPSSYPIIRRPSEYRCRPGVVGMRST